MAENTLAARLLLRYDTYSNWMNSSLILKPGEAAVAILPIENPSSVAPVGIKIGNGYNYFDELPWIQSVAMDVYSWAKQSTKPSYSASEISGLNDYINQHSSGGGSSGGIASSSYRIVYNQSTNKYILQYYNSTTNDWENTSSEIDLSSILNRINTIERWANGARTQLGNIEVPMVEYIYEELTYYLNQLKLTDEAEPHQFVTSVSQQNGQIAVTRSVITASDITSGVFTTEQGGTGISYLEEDEVLVGSINGTIQKYKFVNTIDESERLPLVTAGAVINYVNNKTAGLTGAMHFIGEATVTITNDSNVDPQIQNYNFAQAEAGDVILGGNAAEYVWTGSSWRLLGDEGSYAVKGSIRDADIADNANINVDKISGITTLLNTKVDKVNGKDLSTNDYTDEDKYKLDHVEDGAQVNIIEHVFFNGTEAIPTIVNNLPKSIDLHFNGMTEEQSNKLANIEANAQVNVIEQITVDGVSQPVVNKTVALVTDPHTEHENKIEQIFINGTEWVPNAQKQVRITIDQAALNLNVLEGAVIPNSSGGTTEVPQTQKKLELERIAVTGDVKDLLQTDNTYIILNCGSSTEII